MHLPGRRYPVSSLTPHTELLPQEQQQGWISGWQPAGTEEEGADGMLEGV